MSTLWPLGVATFQSISPFQPAQSVPQMAGVVESVRFRYLLNAADHALFLCLPFSTTSTAYLTFDVVLRSLIDL